MELTDHDRLSLEVVLHILAAEAENPNVNLALRGMWARVHRNVEPLLTPVPAPCPTT